MYGLDFYLGREYEKGSKKKREQMDMGYVAGAFIALLFGLAVLLYRFAPWPQ